jgi:hypothetical protein
VATSPGSGFEGRIVAPLFGGDNGSAVALFRPDGSLRWKKGGSYREKGWSLSCRSREFHDTLATTLGCCDGSGVSNLDCYPIPVGYKRGVALRPMTLVGDVSFLGGIADVCQHFCRSLFDLEVVFG